jgi:hypothetical protein
MRTSEATALVDHLYWVRHTVLGAASQLDEAASPGDIGFLEFDQATRGR